MDKKNIFGFQPVNVYKMIHGKMPPTKKTVQRAPTRARRGRRSLARVHSDLSASDSEDEDGGRCRECIA